MATASPVSKFPLDDGHRAFLPIILRELILCAFQKHEVRSNPFYPWARFSDFSRYIQLVKKKSARVAFKPEHFHTGVSVSYKRIPDTWLRGERDKAL